MDLGAIKQATSQQLPEDEELSERQLTVEVGGRRFVVRVWAADTGSSTPAASGRRPTPAASTPKLAQAPARRRNERCGHLSPMQGTIVKVHHKAGERAYCVENRCSSSSRR